MTRAWTIYQNNRQNRKSQNQLSKCVRIFKSINLAFFFEEIAKNF